MAFTVDDFNDLVKLLEEHPEWRVQLRPVILGEEILAIPSRMDHVEAVLQRVAERLDALTVRVDALTLAQQENARQIALLVERMEKMDGRMSQIEGGQLEPRFSANLGNWLRTWLRKPVAVSVDELDLVDQAITTGKLGPRDVARLAAADLIVRGADRDDASEKLLAIELSTTINQDDVERASDRAEILRSAGYRALSLVGGYAATEAARQAADRTGTEVALFRAPA